MTRTDDCRPSSDFETYMQTSRSARGINIASSTSCAAYKYAEPEAGPSGMIPFPVRPQHDQSLAPTEAAEAAAELPIRPPSPWTDNPVIRLHTANGGQETLVGSGSDDTTPHTFEDIKRNSTSQNKDQCLLIDEHDDDAVSEASRRVERSIRNYQPRNWAKPQQGSDSDKDEWAIHKGGNEDEYDSDLDSELSRDGVRPSREHARKMRVWKSLVANGFENMLLECIINVDSIPPRYENLIVAASTIQQLERVTKRSMNRPKAYNHGVLKGNRITGALLWGPPGTGKSLLAKGLAKQSGYNMIAISTAEIWQKCHGEDEKVIKALFSLGRKLYPCIIFLDEADAMLGARKAGERRHLRSMLNQFLLEWDGLTSGLRMPFILLATNRPFDLDPAVLRRAPVHIKLDLPLPEGRRQILQLLLRGEGFQEDKDRTINWLVNMTQGYTGSDLKSLCVTAASMCVDEQEIDTDERFLTKDHFERALDTVRATALSNMMKNELQNFGGGQKEEDEE